MSLTLAHLQTTKSLDAAVAIRLDYVQPSLPRGETMQRVGVEG